jgi:hypothetical protein
LSGKTGAGGSTRELLFEVEQLLPEVGDFGPKGAFRVSP